MKPLQMLDHVMLWVARVFSVFLALIFPYGFWVEWTDDDTKLIYENTHDLSPYVHIGIDAAFYGLLFSIWIVGIWYKPTNITRILMGLSAGVSAVWLISTILVNSPARTAIFQGAGFREIIECLSFPGWIVLGLLSVVWLAFRPTSYSFPRTIDNPSVFAKPLSS